MNHQRMHQTLKKMAHSRFALSTVVTTLIILVISVLLASVVTYFAINVTSTRVQEESLALAKQHVWYDSSSQKSQAAIMIINAGGRDIVIDRLTVRGQECAWSKVLFFVTGDSISGDLFYNTTLIDGGSISVGGSSRVFKQASADLTLQSGKTLIIYMSNPDSISVNDIGLTVSINIFTSQAMYYKETNVQGTVGSGTTTTGTDNPQEIVAIAAYTPDNGDGNPASVLMIALQNTDSSSIVITKDDLIVNNVQVSSVAFAATTSATTPTEGTAAMESVTIPPGEIMNLFYYDRGTYITGVGEEHSVCLNIEGVHSTTYTAQVIANDGAIYIPQ